MAYIIMLSLVKFSNIGDYPLSYDYTTGFTAILSTGVAFTLSVLRTICAFISDFPSPEAITSIDNETPP